MNSSPLSTRLARFRELIDGALDDYCRFSPACPPRLAEAMRYSLLSGGKRLRPCLVLLASEACGGEAKPALPAACAVEMVHTYSLIHDDLPAMDNDALRRGQPTNHVAFGEATAILAGDGLLTLAFEVLTRDLQPPELATACCADLASAAGATGMVGGQQADIEAERELDPAAVRDVAHLESIHRRKTGRLLGSALLMGGRIAGAGTQALDRLQTYGDCIGLAFQIADDLLDVTSTAQRLGKGVGKDAAHGKLTYPALLGVEESQRRARELIEQACAALSEFGDAAWALRGLAHYVVERDR